MNQLMVFVQNRLKIILRDKILWGLFIFILLFFTYVLSSFINYMDLGSRMPIAVVDEDQTPTSQRIIEGLMMSEALSVNQVSFEDGMKLLKDVRVESLYVFPKGLEQKIQDLAFQGLIQVYYLEGSYAGKVISDIVASEMMADITLAKTLKYYEELLIEKNRYSEEKINQVKEKVDLRNLDKSSFDPIMQIQIIEEDNNETEVGMDNELIYQQVIIGMLSIFLAFFVLFTATSLVKDKELKVDKRLRTIIGWGYLGILSHIISLWIIGSLISFFLSLLIIYKFQLVGFLNFISIFLLLMFYILSLSSFFVMCGTNMRRVITLQISGAMTLIIFSVLGGSFLDIGIGTTILTQLMPNYWFGRGFIEWLIYGDWLRMGQTALLPLFILTIVYSLIGFLLMRMKKY